MLISFWLAQLSFVSLAFSLSDEMIQVADDGGGGNEEERRKEKPCFVY